MRRYKILLGGETFDSAPGGVPDPNALLVEFDITATSVDAPQNGAGVRIWGLGLKAISQTRNYYGKAIEVHGGMARGLPLAKPQQFGLLAKGVVTQAFGQWEGPNQSLDIVFSPGSAPACAGGPNPMPPKKNIVHDWKKGQSIESSLRSALETAFPGMDVAINLTRQLVADQDTPAFHPTIAGFGHYLRRLTQQMAGGHYPGVSIEMSQGKIKVFDEPSKSSTIAFEDLIGMPTWIGPQTIQVKTVMRGDITVDQKITLPRVFVNSSQSGAPVGSWQDQQMSFTGDWTVQQIRHVGNSRVPAGDAWVSIFDCYSNTTPSTQQNDCPTKEGGQ